MRFFKYKNRKADFKRLLRLWNRVTLSISKARTSGFHVEGRLWNCVTLKHQGWLLTIPEHIRRIRYDQLIMASRPASFL